MFQAHCIDMYLLGRANRHNSVVAAGCLESGSEQIRALCNVESSICYHEVPLEMSEKIRIFFYKTCLICWSLRQAFSSTPENQPKRFSLPNMLLSAKFCRKSHDEMHGTARDTPCRNFVAATAAPPLFTSPIPPLAQTVSQGSTRTKS